MGCNITKLPEFMDIYQISGTPCKNQPNSFALATDGSHSSANDRPLINLKKDEFLPAKIT